MADDVLNDQRLGTRSVAVRCPQCGLNRWRLFEGDELELRLRCTGPTCGHLTIARLREWVPSTR